MIHAETPEGAGERSGPSETGEVFVQWKGTDACLDLHCVCGYHGHVDAEFAYGVQCYGCDRVYEMPHTFHIAPSDYDFAVQIAFGEQPNLHVPTGEGVPPTVWAVDSFEPEGDLDTAREELRKLRRQVHAVRELHHREPTDAGHGMDRCAHCLGWWPCTTSQAIGETA